MKRFMITCITMVLGLCPAGLFAGQVLHGIPGGNFNTDFATGKPTQNYPNQGTWTYYQNTNGYSDIVGEGDARHLEMSSAWDYNGQTSVTYTDTATTPTDQPWQISAQMNRMASAYNGPNDRIFALCSGSTSNIVMMMNFQQWTSTGYYINWTAGGESGLFLSSVSIFDVYTTVTFNYDPVTGAAKGTCGGVTVFSKPLAPGLTVNILYFYNRMYGATTGGYDSGAVAIDNIRGATEPLAVLMDDRSGTLYTDAAGVATLQIAFNAPAVFATGDVTVTDSAAQAVPFTLAGSGTDTMILTFTNAAKYDVFNVTLKDTIVSVADGAALDGDLDWMPGGNVTFSFEHRRAMDLDNDGVVDLDDFSQFASSWMN